MSSIDRSIVRTPTVPFRLYTEWLLVTAVGVVLTVAVAIVGATAIGSGAALAWAGGAIVIGAFESWFLYVRLHRNRHPAEGTPAPSLGLANALTLARGWLLAAVGGFAFVEPTAMVIWLPALAYLAGAGLDWLDGAVAKTVGRRTELGANLDLAFDTLGFLIAPVVGVLWGRLPIWYLSLSAARYLFRAGVTARHLRALPVYDLPDSVLRRPLAGLQMAFIGLALAPILHPETVRTLAAIVLIPSLVVFLRDYLAVAGRLQSAKT